MDITRQIETHQVEDGMTLWLLGGPSIAVQTPRALVYLDLFTGPSPIAELHKATADVVNPTAMRRIDATLSTHHDLDHCHRDSLQAIHDGTDALLIGPRSCMVLFREWGFDMARTVELNANTAFQLHDLHVWALPCNDYFDADAVSYMLQSGGVTVFDGGDTLYWSGYRQLASRFSIDLAMLNFARNPPDEIYYMNPAHVARTAQELGAKAVLPKHYDLWEEFLDDPAALGPLLEPAGIGLHILRQGASLHLTRSDGR